MSSSVNEFRAVKAEKVRVTDQELVVDLVDGRTVMVPLQWYPRLANGRPAERRNWRLIGPGEGIHWPELDEDIGVEDLLAGRPSGESQASLRRNHDETFLPAVVELPGCMTEGADEHEALRNLRKALELWLATEISRGASIPDPRPAREYSGKFTVRTSALIHRLAADAAHSPGVSLNEFTSEALALAVGASRSVPRSNGRANSSAATRARKSHK